VSHHLEPYYKVLGLELGASLEEINKAYKTLAFVWHPDRFPQENQELIRSAAEKLKEINHARDLLRSFHRQNPQPYSQPKPQPRTYHQTHQQPKPQSKTYHQTYQQPKSQSKVYNQTQQQSKQSYSYNPRAYSSYSTKKENVRSQSESVNSYYRPYYQDLKGVDLSRANLKEKDFSGRNLSGANLQGADLSDSFLHKVNLEEANLQGANLFRANLLKANLRKANLRDTNLIGADFSGADLSGADLTGAKMGSGQKIMVKLTGTNLKGTIFPDGSIHS
jgi:curved DNA-binding protein CbpA